MRTIKLLIFSALAVTLFSSPSPSSAQTLVHQVIGELDSLSRIQFDNWRYSTDRLQPGIELNTMIPLGRC